MNSPAAWKLLRRHNMALLVTPDATPSMELTNAASVADMVEALTCEARDAGGGRPRVILPDVATRAAFALGASGAWTVDDVPTVRIVDDRSPTPAVAPRSPPPARAMPPTSKSDGVTPFEEACKTLRVRAGWDGAEDPRVHAERAAILARRDAPPDALARVERALIEGERSHRAVDEVQRLARTHGARAARVESRIAALAEELQWPGFVDVARKKIDRIDATQARGLAPQTSTVRASDLDHRITSLTPCDRWTLAIDESGSIPARVGDVASGLEGRFVGLLVPATVKLPALARGWHAVEQRNPAAIDEVLQRVLNAPVGVLGLTLSALHHGVGDAWLAGVLELVHWVCQLLPLGEGRTRLAVEIEQRGEWVDGPAWRAMATAVLRALALRDADRAQRLDLSLRLVTKADGAYDGYVDAVAFTWTSPQRASVARLAQSSLCDTCLVDGDAVMLRGVRDAVVHGEAVSVDAWRSLMHRSDARKQGTFVAGLLDAFAERLRRDAVAWRRYFVAVQQHLESKAIRLTELGREVAFLVTCAPADAVLPAGAQLAWLTARLETANHHGGADDALERQVDDLAARLFDEEPTLACQADLDRAVLATNRLDFDGATRALERWMDVPVAVPGLRHWGRVRSSLGQHAAFRGDGVTALHHFEEALSAFARLSDGGALEAQQTGSYAAIAAMDLATIPDTDVRARVARIVGGSLDAQAVASLAADESAARRYVHHVVVRWVSVRGDVEARAAYLGARDRWASGVGHPWPLIELHRALILHDAGVDVASIARHLEAAIEACDLGSAGPVVRLIATVICAVGVVVGADPPQAFEAVVRGLPQALPRAPWAVLAEALAGRWTEGPRALVRRCLPFNFG
jgi:hypothetical protein